MERAARHRVSAAGGTPQLDRVVSQSARREEHEADRRRAETGGLDHRLGVRFPEGVHHPHRAHGRPHRGRARPAPGPARRARGVTYRVAVADKVAEAGLKLLAQTPEIEVTNCAGKPREELERALAGAHALIVRSETRVTADLLTRGPNLRVIARAGTGVDNIDVHAATRRGIAVMNAPGANTVSAAEHAMGLLLAQVRHIPWAAEAMRRGEWDRKRFEGTELRGKTIGIVGLGRIGGHVAQLARAFGMHVVGHDPYLSPERAAELQLKLLPLDQLLRQADVVTLHVAHTEQTHHLINAARLKLMKPTAVLVNTARGELVDAVALAEAIGEKRIGGAALDVFAVEPLPADSPLRKLERVILTPHLAASTAEAQERVSLEICGAVRAALLAGDLSFAISASRTAPQISRLTRSCASAVDAARWGVRITRSSLRSGESAGSGSTANTSSAAPPMRFSPIASASATASTSSPRAVFTSTAVGFMSVSRAALIRWCVCSVCATCSVTTSAWRSSWSRGSSLSCSSAARSGER